MSKAWRLINLTPAILLRFSQTLRRKQKIITRHVRRHLQTTRDIFECNCNQHDLNAHVKPNYNRYRDFPLLRRREQQAVPCQTENAAAQKYFSQLIGSSLNVKVDWIEKISSLSWEKHSLTRNNFPATFGFSNIEEVFCFLALRLAFRFESFNGHTFVALTHRQRR